MKIRIHPSRIPGNVWRPWLCKVHYMEEGVARVIPTGRHFTQAAAEREAARLAGHVAAGQPYDLEVS